MNDEYKPRFSFEITEEQKMRADSLIEVYGLRKAIFGVVLDEVLDLIEEHGGIAVGILLSKQTKIRTILPTMNKIEEAGKHG